MGCQIRPIASAAEYCTLLRINSRLFLSGQHYLSCYGWIDLSGLLKVCDGALGDVVVELLKILRKFWAFLAVLVDEGHEHVEVAEQNSRLQCGARCWLQMLL